MHIALADLGLEQAWIVYPGSERFPLAKRVTALPLSAVAGLDFAHQL
jgi:hypothetical protein